MSPNEWRCRSYMDGYKMDSKLNVNSTLWIAKSQDVTRCDQLHPKSPESELHEMDPCAKKCLPVKSIGFTLGLPVNQTRCLRNMADMEFWPSEIPKFEDAKPILEKFS